jgi:hypothetical protein
MCSLCFLLATYGHDVLSLLIGGYYKYLLPSMTISPFYWCNDQHVSLKFGINYPEASSPKEQQVQVWRIQQTGSRRRSGHLSCHGLALCICTPLLGLRYGNKPLLTKSLVITFARCLDRNLKGIRECSQNRSRVHKAPTVVIKWSTLIYDLQ